MSALIEEIAWVTDDRGCHVCTSHCRDSHDYPVKWFRGRLCHMSRIVWTQTYGEIPEGLHVLHKCDQPSCIRIDHLFLGTPLDNARDKVSKGRCSHHGMIGEQNSHAKLTESRVLIIRKSHLSGSAIARLFGVSDTTISEIRLRKSWRHI